MLPFGYCVQCSTSINSNLLKHALRELWLFRKTFVIIFTPLILLPLPLLYNTSEARCAYILLMMAVFWITEAVPIYVTALLPIFGLPLAGVVSSNIVCASYISEASVIFSGGLVVAIAIEHSNLHKRIAMLIILKIGHSPRLLLAGFMLTTMILSMWISNVGAVAIMVTVVDGILEITTEEAIFEESIKEDVKETKHNSVLKDSVHFDNERNIGVQESTFIDKYTERNSSDKSKSAPIAMFSEDEEKLQQEKNRKLKYAYYLSVAYAANIGGTGVVTGTAPNLLLMGILADTFTEPTELNFTSWMMMNTPGMALCVFFGWLWLQYRYIGFSKGSQHLTNRENDKKIEYFIQQEYNTLGPITYHEKSVAFLFLLLVPLWIFRDPSFLYGWGRFLEDIYGDDSIKIGDSVPVLTIIFFYFVLPAKNPFKLKIKDGVYSFTKSEGLLNWQIVQDRLAWGLIILLGGGIAMAKASDVSGLSKLFGEELRRLGGLSPPAILVLITSLTTAITEILSNTATTSVIIPVLRELSLGICSNPLYLMLPATVSASFAFMLPVATPPNAIVYYSGGIPSTEMMKAGFVMNLICILVINGVVNTLGGPVFDIHNMPSWANSSTSGTLPNC